MSNILITGMTSAQASEKVNKKSKAFSGVLGEVLSSQSHTVTWGVPSPHATLKDFTTYDSVLVGISPFGSISANYLYGALNLINLLWSSGKLTLFIDAPNASQIEPNIKSIITTPESFIKPFFSKRAGYQAVVSDPKLLSRLITTVSWLANEPWPTTIYPRLPWRAETDIKLPPNAKANLHGLNFDSFYLKTLEPAERFEQWLVDDLNTKWTESVQPILGLPISPMTSAKTDNDETVQLKLAQSTGALIAPKDRNGTWWSYRIAQALSALTPVATDWMEAQGIGSAWAVLPATIESLGPEQRHLLALAQRDIYMANIDTKDAAVNRLKSILKVG